jgi:hypothetical protein
MRVGGDPDETTVEELPLHETGPVPVEVSTATPRFFGVTPPSAILALAAACLAGGIAMLVSGHAIVGGALLGVAVVLGAFFIELARRLPEPTVVRFSAHAFQVLRERGGSAAESLVAQSSARVELFRLRRELVVLLAQRAECARLLGEAVYAGDEGRDRFRPCPDGRAARAGQREGGGDGADSRRRDGAGPARASSRCNPP